MSLAQLAMLAGIPQAPTAGNPINGPERAINRRNLVLRRMLEQDSISQAEFDTATAAPITASLHGRDLDVPAAFPAEWVRRELVSRYSDLYTGGYEVVTTLRGDLQRTADAALRKGLLDYDRDHGYRGPEDQLSIAEENPLTEERVRGLLASIRTYGGLAPAVVMDVGPQSASVIASAWPQSITLDLAAVRWARNFIDPDTRGPAIQSVDQVLSVGDLIRVEYLGKIAPEVAEAAEEAAQPAPEPVDTWRLAQLPEIQGALVSLEPTTGAVLALAGGFDFSMNQYNHALQAARQPGSGFKPFVYSAALDAGITPASIFMDAPLVFEDQNLESDYRPDNDNNRYNGPTRLREALYRSINLVSMRVLLDVGAGQILNYVPRFGFDTSTFPRNTQLAIGGGTMAVTPVDMAAAYAVFANGGWQIQPHIIQSVRDLEGEEIFRPRYPVVCTDCDEEGLAGLAEVSTEMDSTDLTTGEPANLEELFADLPASGDQAPLEQDLPPLLATQAIDPRNAYVMHSMLRDVIRRGTGTRARRELGRSDIAGKTGTTNDAADTWFNGYHPNVATTVWVGFPNHQALGAAEYGSNRPLPIWIDYMREALKGVPETFPDQPPGVVTRKIDPTSGALANARNPDAIFEFFLAEHLPEEVAQPVEDPEEVLKAVDIF
ncbi:MAG: peptidase [Gammaproteobacteria bacterium]|nr:MAG: peptidase [Gammaproteobacteria bacterium]